MMELSPSLILSAVLGAGGAYVAVRTGLAQVTTMIGVLTSAVSDLKASFEKTRESHGEEIGELKERVAVQGANIATLQMQMSKLLSTDRFKAVRE
jgi:hypothetical protein